MNKEVSPQPLLLEGERVDDLQRRGLKIIQNRSLFCFGTDAVLLAWYAGVKEGGRVLDLGTGTGIVPLLMYGRYGRGSYTGLEISARCADMARRSVRMNSLEETITIIHGDIREADRIFPAASFDTVTGNPPYMAADSGIVPKDREIAAARHEILGRLEDFTRAAARALKPGGSFYMVHRPGRLAQIFACLQQDGMEPKRMRFVHPRADKEPSLVLIEAVRGAGAGLTVQAPLILYEADGTPSAAMNEIYGQEAEG